MDSELRYSKKLETYHVSGNIFVGFFFYFRISLHVFGGFLLAISSLE